MARPLKIVLWIAGVLILLMVAIAIAVPLLFDPNDYRDRISASVKDATGREFSFAAIKLRAFPWLHVSISDARLGNAPGFGSEPFAQIGEAGVGVRLLPLLFQHRIEVSTLTLSGLRLNLARDKNGADNWSDIGKQAPAEPPANDAHVDGSFDMKALDIGGVDIKDSAVAYVDAQGGKQYRIEGFELGTGSIRAGKAFDLKAKGRITSTAPAADLAMTLKGSVLPDPAAHQFGIDDFKLELKGKALDNDLDSTLTGKLAADLAAKVFHVSGIELDAELSGASLPGGKQVFGFTGDLDYDQAKGTMTLAQAQLNAAGLKIDTTITGENLNGDAPHLSGPITVAAFNPREWLTRMGQKLDTTDADALKQASLSAQYSGSFKTASFDKLVLKLDQTTAQGSVTVRDFETRALEFALKVDTLDADRYVAPKVKTEAAGTADGKTNVNDIKLPTDTLAKLNASGTVDIGSLKLNGIKMTDVRLKLSGPAGAQKTQDVSARLYGGTFSTSNRISPGQAPEFALKTELTALNAAPFLQDFLGKDYVSGLGNLTLNLTGRGTTVGEVRRALNGDVSFRLENGAVKGFNLGAILRKAQAALAGDLAYHEDAPKQTDFTAFTATAKIVNGILKNDALDGSSPAIRLAGSGEIDLVNETINYLARPTIVESKSGQGGKGLDQLKGITVPIRITGNLFAPAYKLDLQDALKQKAGDELHKVYEKQEDRAKEKIRQRLGDLLFGKKPQPAPDAPAPAPAPAAPQKP